MDQRAIGFQDCMLEISNYLIGSEGFELTNPLRLRILSHLECYKDKRILKNASSSPLSPHSSSSSIFQSQSTRSASLASPNQISTTQAPESMSTQTSQISVQYMNNPTKFKQDNVVPIQTDLGFFNRNFVQANYQPPFGISNYSQNAIKISNYYNLGTDSNIIRPSNYWNSSIA